MKLAMATAALIGTATMAAANDTISIISASAVGNGQYEVITQEDGLYTLRLVNCLPMRAGLLDSDFDINDLYNGGNADMVDVVRGTTEHSIAVYACES